MKKINLLSIDNILSAQKSILSDQGSRECLGLIDLKEIEIPVIHTFCDLIRACADCHCHKIGEDYYLNYKIPQIGKEFDLLRFDDKRIVNIELKSQINKEAILKQLERNHYYLSFLQKKTVCFTYFSNQDESTIFKYDEGRKRLEEVAFDLLAAELRSLKSENKTPIESLFEPSNYLISPFNDTERFMSGKYFLTNHQEKIKNRIIKGITEGKDQNRYSVSGSAGTGKTLLTYDLAKDLIAGGRQVIIIHCASTNKGINLLNKEKGWKILPIREFKDETPCIKNSDILIFDESQRISVKQLESVLELKKDAIVFSHDVNQKLNRTHQAKKVVDRILNECKSNTFELSNKIRHNKNLLSFIKKVFNRNDIKIDKLSKNDYSSVSFYYTNENKDADRYIRYLREKGWEHVYLTTSIYSSDPLDDVVFGSPTSAHKAIGQEFENVTVTITEQFFYNSSNRLAYRGHSYYSPIETLFQAVTRTRKNLCFVIIKNEEFLNNCINIMQNRKQTED